MPPKSKGPKKAHNSDQLKFKFTDKTKAQPKKMRAPKRDRNRSQ